MADSTPDMATERYRRRPETVVTDCGDGPPVLFAHGTLMDRTMFDPQVNALETDYRTVAYDLRARTDQYATEYDLSDLADDLAALADALDIDSFVLCGMSMGGFMALRFAERYPERLEGVVLIDAMAEAYTDAERGEYRAMLEAAHEEGFSESMADMVRSQLFGETTREENPELTRRWAERWRTYPVEAFDNEMDSWIDEPEFTPQLSNISTPVLSVHGEEDVSIDPERTASMLEALPNAHQKMIPNAGHSSNLENPAAVNDAISEFLDEVY